jgi:hypothetical protein
MKHLFITVTVLGLLQLAEPGQAQVNVHVNIGMQPQWGPAGYDYAEYYYMPDIDVYYNVPRRQFVYLNGGRWVFAACLPAPYRSYDLYRGYKIVINDPAPYQRCDYYRRQYGHYRGYDGRYDRDDHYDRDRHYDRDDRYERDDRYTRYEHHDNGKHNGHRDRDDRD